MHTDQVCSITVVVYNLDVDKHIIKPMCQFLVAEHLDETHLP